MSLFACFGWPGGNNRWRRSLGCVGFGDKAGMSRISVACAVAGAVIGVLAVPPAFAGSGSASVAGVSVTYTVADEARFDGPGCADVPWSVSYRRPADWDLYVDFDLRQTGSNSPYTDSASPLYADPDSGTLTGSMCISDSWNPGRGVFTLGGTLKVEDDNYRTVGEAALPTSTVKVTRNASKVRLKAKAGKTYSNPPTVRGSATAHTATKGTLGVSGTVVVEARYKGKWRRLTETYPDDFGKFSTTLSKQIPQGMKVRARLIDCGWCTDAKATTRAR